LPLARKKNPDRAAPDKMENRILFLRRQRVVAQL
jgi:hypothetical protein